MRLIPIGRDRKLKIGAVIDNRNRHPGLFAWIATANWVKSSLAAGAPVDYCARSLRRDVASRELP
jgi:hypothetical protein